MRLSKRGSGGFSLIELMISILVGLIISGGAISLAVSHIRNNTLVVSATRLSQETRAMREIIVREVRRSRMNGASLNSLGAGATASEFDVLSAATAGCIQYAYDADLDGVADTGEFRSLALNDNGQLLLGRFAAVADIDCTVGTVLNSPEVQIAALTFTINGNLVMARMQTRLTADAAVTRDSFITIRVRSGRVL